MPRMCSHGVVGVDASGGQHLGVERHPRRHCHWHELLAIDSECHWDELGRLQVEEVALFPRIPAQGINESFAHKAVALNAS